MKHPYDFVVIGGGSAGYNAAQVAVGLGKRVAVIDGARKLGGPVSYTHLDVYKRQVLAVAGAWLIAGDVIQARLKKTEEQVAAMWAQGGIGSRSILYHDTWRMAQEHLLFGWGMGSFPAVFSLYNSQESKIDRLPVIYHDAHSDWLQSVAEVGLAGTALIGAAVALPALALRRTRVTPVPYFLLCGCALTAAYAWIEFPFGNVAVVLGWWLCFFSAVHYVRLTGQAGEPPAP